jgi:hypothetical protein
MRTLGQATQETDRGQTAVLGFAIIIFIAVALIGAIVAFGLTALDEGRAAAEFSQAEQSMTVFDARSDRVAFEDDNVERVDFGATGSGVVFLRPDEGRVRVHHNFSSAAAPDDKTLYDRRLGSVRYYSQNRTLAYQGSGVFRYEGNRTIVVTDPEIGITNGTLQVPIVRTNGTGTAQGDVQTIVEAGDDRGAVYPNASRTYSDNTPHANPVERGRIEVLVTSPFYRGWERHFEARTNGTVTTFHGNETVRATFDTDTNVSRLYLTDAAINVTVS